MNTTDVVHPFYPDKHARFQSFEEYEQQMLIQEIDGFEVIYERHIGNYMELEKNWSNFIEKYKDYDVIAVVLPINIIAELVSKKLKRTPVIYIMKKQTN